MAPEKVKLEDIINVPVSKRKLVMPSLVCKDGFRFSVQASEGHYCTPRDNEGPWEEVEVGYPSKVEELLLPFAENPFKPTETVYPYVPVHLVKEIIKKHGGLAE